MPFYILIILSIAWVICTLSAILVNIRNWPVYKKVYQELESRKLYLNYSVIQTNSEGEDPDGFIFFLLDGDIKLKNDIYIFADWRFLDPYAWYWYRKFVKLIKEKYPYGYINTPHSKTTQAIIQKDIQSTPEYTGENLQIGKNVQMGENLLIGRNVEIGDDAVIEDIVTLDRDVYIGDNVTIGAGATLYEGAFIGDDVIIGKHVYVGERTYIRDDVRIDDEVNIGKCCSIYAGTTIKSCTDIGESTVIEEMVNIDGWVNIGIEVTIGRGCIIGEHAFIDDNVMLDADVQIEPNVNLTQGSSYRRGAIIKYGDHGVLLLNGYKYVSGYYFDSNPGEIVIRLGCHHRSIEEWDNDFNNNPGEFPPNSAEWQKRKRTYDHLKEMAMEDYKSKILKNN